MNKKLDILLYVGLFSGLGIFSYLLLINYFGFSPQVAEELYCCFQYCWIFHDANQFVAQ